MTIIILIILRSTIYALHILTAYFRIRKQQHPYLSLLPIHKNRKPATNCEICSAESQRRHSLIQQQRQSFVVIITIPHLHYHGMRHQQFTSTTLLRIKIANPASRHFS